MKSTDNTTMSESKETKKRSAEQSGEKREMTGAEAVIKSLEAQGVDVIFGVIGGAIMPVYDRLGKSTKLRHITAAHEQGAVHAADGYARATGRAGVCFATSGPGASNMVTGLATAYMDSSPVIGLTGQVSTDLIGSDAFQEADMRGISNAITKHNYLVQQPSEIPSTINEAFHLAVTGRPGPVLVDLPKDVQTGSFEGTIRKERTIPEGYDPSRKTRKEELIPLARHISAAEKPVIIAGGGVLMSGAGEELQNFATEYGIPVTCSLMGLGSFPTESELFLGMLGMHGTGEANKAVTNSDLLIALGTRLDDRMTGKVDKFAPNATLAHIDIDPSELGKILKPDISVVGDAGQVLTQLYELVSEEGKPDTDNWVSKIEEWRKKYKLEPKSDGSHLSSQIVVDALNELTPADTIVTTGVGQHQMWVAQRYSFTPPRKLITSGGLGTMGYGFPAAIGAKIGAPDRTVICVTGDGSFQMNIQELSTAVREKLDITVVILRNNYLGMVRQWQELFFEDNIVETKIGNGVPSFAKVAEAYGAKGIPVRSQENLKDKLEEAFSYTEGPSIVECAVDEEENVFPIVPAGEANENFLLEGGN